MVKVAQPPRSFRRLAYLLHSPLCTCGLRQRRRGAWLIEGRVFRHAKYSRLAVTAVAGGTPVLTVLVLQLQGVQLQGYSQPMLQAMGSPSAAGRSTVVQLNSNAALAHLLTLPRCATGFLGSFSDS